MRDRDGIDAAAETFCRARAAAQGFDHFPGEIPATLSHAYDIQSLAIERWPDAVQGWKVGRIDGDLARVLGEDRFVGPIFKQSVIEDQAAAAFPVIERGFGAFEAEFVVKLAHDAPIDHQSWAIEDVRALVGALHIGIEVAGSPLSSINVLGPLATIAGFGNNAGLLLGPAVANWDALTLDQLTCEVMIDGEIVGKASARTLPGGPLSAFIFALEKTAALGRPLKAGQFICTGAITGVHPFEIGQHAHADFGAHGRMDCLAMKASPQLSGSPAGAVAIV
jgi:2-keto-4-pentenoate hydratase